MARSKLDLFRSVEIFLKADEARLERLATTSLARDYAPGDVLFLEGQPCQGLWIIGEGSAQIVKTTPTGRQLVLATQIAPSTVAEVPVFDGGPYPASLIAVQPTWAVLIHKPDFLALCRSDADLAMHFLQVFGRRLRQLVGLAERVTFGTIRQRLALELLEQADRAGSNTFQMEETQEHLATRLGTVREVISRNLGRFQAEELVKLDRRQVTILSRPGLENEAATEL